MTLESSITDLVTASNALTTTVDGKMASIDAKVAQAQIDFNGLTPEKRIVKTFTIGGSEDYLYPVWFSLLDNNFGVSTITFARNYNKNAGDPIGSKIGIKNNVHIYSLLLEMEGNATKWNGDANFLKIKRFFERYDVGCSHVAFMMNLDVASSSSSIDYSHSGLYLRGGGLTYNFIANNNIALNFDDGSKGVNNITNIFNSGSYNFNVKPIFLGVKDATTGLYPNIQTPPQGYAGV